MVNRSPTFIENNIQPGEYVQRRVAYEDPRLTTYLANNSNPN